MRRITIAIAAAVLAAGLLATSAMAAEESSRSGTASIEWRREGGGSGGGGSGGSSGGGGGSGGGSGGNSSGGGSANSRHPAVRYDIFNRVAVPETIVSIPNPQIPLGRLPETGGNYVIPLLFVSAGISLLLACAISRKGIRPP